MPKCQRDLSIGAKKYQPGFFQSIFLLSCLPISIRLFVNNGKNMPGPTEEVFTWEVGQTFALLYESDWLQGHVCA